MDKTFKGNAHDIHSVLLPPVNEQDDNEVAQTNHGVHPSIFPLARRWCSARVMLRLCSAPYGCTNTYITLQWVFARMHSCENL